MHGLGDCESADDEFLAGDAFRLDPAVAAAGVVRAIPPLGDNTFQPHLAAFAKEGGTVHLKVLAELNPTQAPGLQQFRQQLFSLHERQWSQVMPVEIEEVEDIVDEVRRRAPFAGVLQVLKAADATREKRDDFVRRMTSAEE